MKYTGGKSGEIGKIMTYLPQFKRYIEPFVGAGALFFHLNKPSIINDYSSELMNLYGMIQSQNAEFRDFLQMLCDEFSGLDINNGDEIYDGIINTNAFIDGNACLHGIACENNSFFVEEVKKSVANKISRTQNRHRETPISSSDKNSIITTAVKSAYYVYVRHLYNNCGAMSLAKQAAVYFFIRELCYSSMSRYNSKGEFNVPYGGQSYNSKNMQKKLDYLFSEEMRFKLSGTELHNEDFEDFLGRCKLGKDDFVFLDPPYDTVFSDYSNNAFGQKEHERLAACLRNIKAKFMLIINETEFILDLYCGFNMESFDKRYDVNFRNRNNQHTRYLLVMNYWNV